MTLRFVGIDPNTGGEGSPTVWLEKVSADLVLQGEEADELLKALSAPPSGSSATRWGCAHERVSRLRFRMVPILREACDAAERAAAEHRDVR